MDGYLSRLKARINFLGNLFGTRCGKDCGSWEGGKTALEYAAMGVFDNAPVTEWKRGTNQWVYWKSGAQHRGGYAYRLCKVNKYAFKSKYILSSFKEPA